MAVAAVRPVAPPVLTKEVVLHDQFNLLVLPIIGTAVLGGLLGFIDTMLVSAAWCRGGGGAASRRFGREGRRGPVLASLTAYIHSICCLQVTKSFIAYIVADFLWILVEPRAVPSKWVCRRGSACSPRLPPAPLLQQPSRTSPPCQIPLPTTITHVPLDIPPTCRTVAAAGPR